jgi:choline dehydrogenase-like flavoprotein
LIIDGFTIELKAELAASVCIVGSGPAGLTLATALCKAGVDVLVVESGGTAIDAWAQALNEGPVVGDDYAGLGNTRHRQLGGTVHAWNTPIQGEIGAKYLPLDPSDFDIRDRAGPLAAWPIPYDALRDGYRQAHDVCGLGPLDYGPEPVLAVGRVPFDLSQGQLRTRIYRFGRAASFVEDAVAALEATDRARVYTGLTAIGLRAGPGRQVSGVVGTRGPGDRLVSGNIPSGATSMCSKSRLTKRQVDANWSPATPTGSSSSASSTETACARGPRRSWSARRRRSTASSKPC